MLVIWRIKGSFQKIFDCNNNFSGLIIRAASTEDRGVSYSHSENLQIRPQADRRKQSCCLLQLVYLRVHLFERKTFKSRSNKAHLFKPIIYDKLCSLFFFVIASCVKHWPQQHARWRMNERSKSQNQTKTSTMLRVAVSSAVNLPNVETIGKSDPYVVLNFQGLYCCVFVRFHIAWRCGEQVNDVNNNIQHVKHSLNIKLTIF